MNFSFAYDSSPFEVIRAAVLGWVDHCDGDIEEAALACQHFHRWAIVERLPDYTLACAANAEWSAALADMPAKDLARLFSGILEAQEP